MDVEQLQSILEQTNACFQKQTFFAHRPHNKILHDSKEIKKYAFAQLKKWTNLLKKHVSFRNVLF